jgi:hypothetical protein
LIAGIQMFCSDGASSEVKRVVLDPATGVVRSRHWPVLTRKRAPGINTGSTVLPECDRGQERRDVETSLCLGRFGSYGVGRHERLHSVDPGS